MKCSIFIILLFFSLTFAKNNLIIDKNLQNFRQEYREFKWITKILCDKSFFEVYLAAGIELKKIENVMKNTSNYFEKWNSEILVKSLKFNANERFKIVKGNVKSLLQTASNIHQKGLNELFSGDLTSPSPPMEYLDDLFDEIEFHVEDVFEIYSNNSICVARMFKEFLPLFDEIVGEILKIGKTMKIKIFKKYFKKSEEMAVDSDRYVKNFVQKLNDCVTTKDIDRCVIKVIKKETECHAFCGKLYSSIRSTIWSTALAVQNILDDYKKSLDSLGDAEEYAKDKIAYWIEKIKNKCD